uniref:Uncharacterized protein n=1 Tax=Chromera velia CCMP2878 TaxID=1169474 RepID=A0A0G4HWV0_9ALVE|eukprot:Cvel_9137.t1-p1 / transcript=Cvel_9137.t1 / gene=Cvel_9137 / organism=Chromera_velia_CCMP2878 / gene_product=hypothetical protein / transcript_product=hypothetical protein / location=Cvel_scaffold519:76750-82332(-) / protein_length=388 / sequence_SO=supercontig / SO=protein_coding / is_pseudo=false
MQQSNYTSRGRTRGEAGANSGFRSQQRPQEYGRSVTQIGSRSPTPSGNMHSSRRPDYSGDFHQTPTRQQLSSQAAPNTVPTGGRPPGRTGAFAQSARQEGPYRKEHDVQYSPRHKPGRFAKSAPIRSQHSPPPPGPSPRYPPSPPRERRSFHSNTGPQPPPSAYHQEYRQDHNYSPQRHPSNGSFRRIESFDSRPPPAFPSRDRHPQREMSFEEQRRRRDDEAFYREREFEEQRWRSFPSPPPPPPRPHVYEYTDLDSRQGRREKGGDGWEGEHSRDLPPTSGEMSDPPEKAASKKKGFWNREKDTEKENEKEKGEGAKQPVLAGDDPMILYLFCCFGMSCMPPVMLCDAYGLLNEKCEFDDGIVATSSTNPRADLSGTSFTEAWQRM